MPKNSRPKIRHLFTDPDTRKLAAKFKAEFARIRKDPALLQLVSQFDELKKAIEIQQAINPEVFRPEGPVDDLLGIVGPGREDEARKLAAQRIARRLGNVIHKKRWAWVQPELRRRAELEKVSEEKALENLIVDRLFEVGQSIAGDTPGNWKNSYKTLRRQLNKFLTTDLLGPQWRSKISKREIGLDQALTLESVLGPNLIAQIEVRASVESLIFRAKLTNREKEVLYARLKNEPYDAIARKLKIKTDTARVFYSRAFNKMKNSS
jgi:Bacterial regulatory proteins, luxR family